MATTYQKLLDLPIGAYIRVTSKSSTWEQTGQMEYLLGTKIKKVSTIGTTQGVFTLDEGRIWVSRKKRPEERWALNPDNVDIVGVSVLATVGVSATGVLGANLVAARIAAGIEAGRIVTNAVAASLALIPGLPAGASELMGTKIGKLLIANKLQLLASSGALPGGKTQEAMSFISSGALASAYLDIVHSWDIDGIIQKLTADIMPSSATTTTAVEQTAKEA